MAKKKSSKTEEEIVEPAKEEDVNVDDIIDDVEASGATEEVSQDEEEKPDQSHITMVSGLQPHRPKPGYPQNLKNHRGFGYQP